MGWIDRVDIKHWNNLVIWYITHEEKALRAMRLKPHLHQSLIVIYKYFFTKFEFHGQ